MLFCTFEYLAFFPVVTIIYYLCPQKLRQYWLLAVSLFFYGCWKAEYLALIVFSILVTFFAAYAIGRLKKDDAKRNSAGAQRAVLILCLFLNLSVLFVFKYFNFLAETVNSLLSGERIGLLNVLLPVGISFYTFQAIGYTIDVYRGTIEAEKNILTYALFVCFFPQLVAGPIERSGSLLPQLKKKHSFDYGEMKSGLLLIGWGFFTKLVIADRVSIFVDGVYGGADESAGMLALATLLFTIQIYCDFASYSNIARGSAQVLGITLMRNFNLPYFSRTISEYWSRWHISLSTWFRDYLYIPLGGNRKGAARTLLNLLIVFAVSGLWHGAAWTYVLWGAAHGLYSAAGRLTDAARCKLRSRMGINEKSGLYNLWRTLFVFFIVNFANIFFRADSVGSAFSIIKRIFTLSSGGAAKTILSFGLDAKDLVVAAAAVLVLTAVDLLSRKRDLRAKILCAPLAAQWAVYIALIVSVAVFGIYGPQYDAAPFIYFQF